MAPQKRKAADPGGSGGDANKAAKNGSSASFTNACITRNIKTMNTDASRKAVFDTTELIEEILMNVPAKQVFACQRVSRQFSDVIQISVRIQKKFFNIPSRAPRLTWAIEREESDPRRYFLDCVYHLHKDAVPEPGIYVKHFTPMRVCPLSIHRPVEWTVAERMRHRWLVPHTYLEFGFTKLPTERASWSKVLVTNPPCQAATISFRWHMASEIACKGEGDVVSVTDPKWVNSRTACRRCLKS